MFIHWGLYALPARGEWLRHFDEKPEDAYLTYFDHFNPDMFDPKEWAKSARMAGMKYVVITAKHHDGFCLWDSKHTDFKVTKTKFGRDVLREIIDAFRSEGLRIGIYYSLIDWHHEDFIIDRHVGPYRNGDLDKLNQGRDMKRYAQYMRDQVIELLTEFGKVDILWFDFSYPKTDGSGKGKDDWEAEKLVELIRSLQPGVLLDNRLDLPEASDIKTPEQYTPDNPLVDENGNVSLWEGCQTFSGSWGYNRDEGNWKTPQMCIEMLVNHVSRGGNLLMNVGPTARGFLDDRTQAGLTAYADWMKFNARAVYGCGMAPKEFCEPKDCRYTWNPETKCLYLHLFTYPFKHIHLPDLAGKINYAQLLADGSEITIRSSENEVHTNLNSGTPDNAITLELPVKLPSHCTVVPVIELFLK